MSGRPHQRQGRESAESVARNFLWNLSAGGWGVLLALVATPIVVHRLGAPAYGVYALFGVLLAYLKFTELGMSRAVERHAAAAVGAQEEDRVVSYAETALWLQCSVALLVGTAVAVGGPAVLHLFEIPPEHEAEAEQAIRWMAVGMAVSFVTGIPNALLRAYQRFSTLNRISIVSQTFLTSLLVTAALVRPTLVALVLATVIGSVFRFALATVFGLRLLPRRPRPRLDRESLRELLSFGGSLTLASLIAPILVHSEKLLMGGLVGTAALTYYIVPYRVLSRFSLVSGALSNALFPFLSDLEGRGSRLRMRRTTGRATGLLAWVLLPPFALILVAGDRLLALWMGEGFANQARGILPFLAVGTFVNLLAHNSVAAIQARGRPGLLAWLYLGELVVYVPLAWGLMVRFGAQGAAAAWCGRVTADTFLLLWIAGRLLPDSPTRPSVSRPWPTVTALALVLAGVLITAGPVHGTAALAVGLVLAATLSLLAWLVALTARERAACVRAAVAMFRWRTA